MRKSDCQEVTVLRRPALGTVLTYIYIKFEISARCRLIPRPLLAIIQTDCGFLLALPCVNPKSV
jgi:hypothetical protein